MKNLLIGFFALGLLGCATRANYEASLGMWLGSEESSLVRAWGPPQSVYENGDLRYLTYQYSNRVVVPGQSPSYNSTVIGNSVYTTPVGGYGPIVVNRDCTTTFEIKAGKVSSWRAQGNACVQ